jgi:hypothetical protein
MTSVTTVGTQTASAESRQSGGTVAKEKTMTPKITKFTNENLVPLRNAVNDALGSVGKKFNVTFTLPRIALIDERYASAELSLSTNTAEGIPQEVAVWNDQNLVPLGLKKEWLGKTFYYAAARGGGSFTITGLSLEERRYPVQACKSGQPNKRYRFTADTIRGCFDEDFREELTAKRASAKAEQANKAREDWKMYAELRSLKPEWLDQTFWHSYGTYKIVGLLPKSRTRCVLCVRLSDNSEYIFRPEMVRKGMSKQSEAAA